MLSTPSDISLQSINGIWIEGQTRQRFQAFEDQYIHVRDKEQRIFSIEEIRQLPVVNSNHPHAQEWKIREKSIARFTHFLKNKKIDRAMDIGCGTGFFANILSQYCNSVAGVEVNLTELKQATEAFKGNDKLQWFYADVLNRNIFEEGSYDLITFCCSFQYFPHAAQILDACFYYLKPGGAVHIIDTPFYEIAEQDKARKASKHYYQSMGCDTLAQHYFHHTFDDLKPFQVTVHYRKKKGIFSSFFTDQYDSPFPWIEITKP
jgi:ubiquinone/menaquinone biosynthesis C-methylase UbiE